MKVIVTGEKGFLGYHLTQYFRWIKGHEVISVGRDFQDHSELFDGVDLVIHTAGVNRGSDAEVFNGNVNLANELAEIAKGRKFNIIFTSSIQEDLDNFYGKSKKESGTILKKACEKMGASFYSFKLPNIFGPFSKPYYNTFIATFCDQISKGEKPVVMVDREVPLIYVQDVCSLIYNLDFKISSKTRIFKVTEILKILEGFHSKYSKGIIPDVKDRFFENLFNTYRSFVSPVSRLEKRIDDRGYLIELLKCEGGQSQLFYSVTKPGIVRGNHFHFKKIERFMILRGKALIEIRRVGGHDVKSWTVEENDNLVIDMPILHTHSLKNIGKDELICAFWTQVIFDSEDPDTYFEIV